MKTPKHLWPVGRPFSTTGEISLSRRALEQETRKPWCTRAFSHLWELGGLAGFEQLTFSLDELWPNWYLMASTDRWIKFEVSHAHFLDVAELFFCEKCSFEIKEGKGLGKGAVSLPVWSFNITWMMQPINNTREIARRCDSYLQSETITHWPTHPLTDRGRC